MRADFGVTYTELGVAIALFNIVTGFLQTPAGFLVDRFSARAVLIGGLLLGAASLVGAALVSSFYLFVAMFALLGVANATYHPADYALLSGRVSPARMSQAYSIHIFAGFSGTAAAPATLLDSGRQLRLARRVSCGGRARTLLVAAIVLLFGEVMAGRDPARIKEKEAGEKSADSRILFTAPILLSLWLLHAARNDERLAYVRHRCARSLVGHIALARDHRHYGLSRDEAFAVLVGGFISARRTVTILLR